MPNHAERIDDLDTKTAEINGPWTGGLWGPEPYVVSAHYEYANFTAWHTHAAARDEAARLFVEGAVNQIRDNVAMAALKAGETVKVDHGEAVTLG